MVQNSQSNKSILKEKKELNSEIIKVLHVDDSEDFLVISKIYLEKISMQNVHVECISSPEEVIEHLKMNMYDVLISDYQMPIIDGLFLLEQLRSQNNDIPFIIFTGKGREEVAIQALNLGADYYVKKGSDAKSQFTELVHLIKRIVKEKNLEKELYETQGRVKAFFEHSGLGIAFKNLQGEIIQVNKALKDMLEYEEEELLKLSISKVSHPEDTQKDNELLKEIIEGKRDKYSIEKRYIKKNGQIIWVNKTVILVPSSAIQNTLIINIFEDITERIERDLEIYRINRVQEMLIESNKTLFQANDLGVFLNEICRILTTTGEYLLAWIGLAENEETKIVRPIAQVGFDKGYLDTVKITWDNTVYGQGPTGTAIRTGKIIINRETATEPTYKPWRTDAIKRGYAASIALPLKSKERILGALNIYSEEKHVFNKKEVDILENLSCCMSYGMMKL
ncbi:MAG: PAS domain S-box protein [Candidatus Heimdallarchaeaceae archaeon]